MVSMIIVDSNIWIFAEDASANEHTKAAHKIQKIIDTTTFGINVIIISEVFHILSRLLSTAEASRRVLHIIENPASEWLEFSDDIVKGSIPLAEDNHIRINDALIAQQALALKASVLTDNIKDFKKIKGLKIVKLR